MLRFSLFTRLGVILFAAVGQAVAGDVPERQMFQGVLEKKSAHATWRGEHLVKCLST